MTCAVLKTEAVVVACCTADSMWDDPASKGLADYLNAVTERARLERERALDLQRQLELYPETEDAVPEIVPAELVLEWDAYEG
jgi:hypothetical protein